MREIAAKGRPVVTTAAHRVFLFPATVDFPERLEDPRLEEDFGPEIWNEVHQFLEGWHRAPLLRDHRPGDFVPTRC